MTEENVPFSLPSEFSRFVFKNNLHFRVLKYVLLKYIIILEYARLPLIFLLPAEDSLMPVLVVLSRDKREFDYSFNPPTKAISCGTFPREGSMAIKTRALRLAPELFAAESLNLVCGCGYGS